MNILRTISRKSFTPNQDKDSLITSVYSSNLSGGFRFLFPSICSGSLLRFCLLLALMFCLINLLFLCFCLIGLLTAVSTKVFPAFKSCCNEKHPLWNRIAFKAPYPIMMENHTFCFRRTFYLIQYVTDFSDNYKWSLPNFTFKFAAFAKNSTTVQNINNVSHRVCMKNNSCIIVTFLSFCVCFQIFTNQFIDFAKLIIQLYHIVCV